VEDKYYQIYSDRSSSSHPNLHENTKMKNNNDDDLDTELKTQSIDRLDIPNILNLVFI